MGDTVGSNKKFSINGTSFRIAADSNFDRMMTKYENKRIATSGKSMRQMIKRVTSVEGIDLIVNASEISQLKTYAESLDDSLLSYTTAAGDEYKAVGSFNVDKVDTESGKATVTADPEDDWTPFIA